MRHLTWIESCLRSTRGRLILLLGFIALVGGAYPGEACHDGSPLILDLGGDGLIRTVGDTHPVSFDIDADGVEELVLWTFWEDEDGFLVLDRNGNHIVDDGSELFGDATDLPTGEKAPHGFAALAVYDDPALGGDSDGVITNGDAIWNDLRVWIDRNHDGRSQPREIAPLRRFGIVGIGLEFLETDDRDGNGNRHDLQGSYLRMERGGGRLSFVEHPMHDVFFQVLHVD